MKCHIVYEVDIFVQYKILGTFILKSLDLLCNKGIRVYFCFNFLLFKNSILVPDSCWANCRKR